LSLRRSSLRPAPVGSGRLGEAMEPSTHGQARGPGATSTLGQRGPGSPRKAMAGEPSALPCRCSYQVVKGRSPTVESYEVAALWLALPLPWPRGPIARVEEARVALGDSVAIRSVKVLRGAMASVGQRASPHLGATTWATPRPAPWGAWAIGGNGTPVGGRNGEQIGGVLRFLRESLLTFSVQSLWQRWPRGHQISAL